VINLATNASDALEGRPGEVVIATGMQWAETGELPPLEAGRILPAACTCMWMSPTQVREWTPKRCQKSSILLQHEIRGPRSRAGGGVGNRALAQRAASK